MNKSLDRLNNMQFKQNGQEMGTLITYTYQSQSHFNEDLDLELEWWLEITQGAISKQFIVK